MGEILRAALAEAMHKLNTVKGGRRIADSFWARAICGEGAAVADLKCGSKAIVLLQDHVGRAMYLWGQHDPRVAHVMEAVVSEGDTVLDIGANFGVLGLLASKMVGRSGTVHLFEPQPLVAQCLRTSLILNGYTHAEVHECALSTYSGFAEMVIVEPANLGMTMIAPPGCALCGPRIRVRIENAAAYVSKLPRKRAAVVKIDVENHEGIILRALQDWLSDVVPVVILFECHIPDTGFWNEESVKVLAQLDYQFFAYDLKKYRSTRLYRVMSHNAFPAGYDFVALHPSVAGTGVYSRLQNVVIDG
jgi:FkbM family methyltransferase